MLPDTGERYLSTPLFANVPADMTEEEIAISRSTPSYQFPTPSLTSEGALPDAPDGVKKIIRFATMIVPARK